MFPSQTLKFVKEQKLIVKKIQLSLIKFIFTVLTIVLVNTFNLFKKKARGNDIDSTEENESHSCSIKKEYIIAKVTFYDVVTPNKYFH